MVERGFGLDIFSLFSITSHLLSFRFLQLIPLSPTGLSSLCARSLGLRPAGELVSRLRFLQRIRLAPTGFYFSLQATAFSDANP